jgi:hypothetical protein
MTYYRNEWLKSIRTHAWKCEHEEKLQREAKIHLEMHRMNEPLIVTQKDPTDPKGRLTLTAEWFEWLKELWRLEYAYRRMP